MFILELVKVLRALSLGEMIHITSCWEVHVFERKSNQSLAFRKSSHSMGAAVNSEIRIKGVTSVFQMPNFF